MCCIHFITFCTVNLECKTNRNVGLGIQVEVLWEVSLLLPSTWRTALSGATVQLMANAVHFVICLKLAILCKYVWHNSQWTPNWNDEVHLRVEFLSLDTSYSQPRPLFKQVKSALGEASLPTWKRYHRMMRWHDAADLMYSALMGLTLWKVFLC